MGRGAQSSNRLVLIEPADIARQRIAMARHTQPAQRAEAIDGGMADALLLAAGELAQAAQRLAEAEEMSGAGGFPFTQIARGARQRQGGFVPICMASA
jgi:hypothetical protein